MTTRKERLEAARIQLANVVSTLMSQTNPCGPFISDLECAESIIAVAKKLGVEESAQVQLDKADSALGWYGTGQGRLERIKTLRDK